VTMDGVTSSLTVNSGTSATCDTITIEGGTATIGGDITANNYINMADSGPDQTLKIGSGSTITGDILSGTPGADTGGTRGTLEFKGSANVTGNIGEGGTESFKLITVGNNSVTIDGDIRATTINFAGDHDLHIGDSHTLTTGAASGVTATTGGDGTLIFDGSATVNSNIGAGAWGTRIKEVSVAAAGSSVNFNGTIYSDTITINNTTAAAVIGTSGTNAVTNFNLTAGTLNLGANTVTLGGAAAGNYTQAAGTTLKTTIQSTAVAGNINASGAASGKCAITGASELSITVDPVYIPSNTTWTILDGAAGTKGVAVLPTITSDSRVLTFAAAAANGGDDLTITATRIANVYANAAAGNSNAAAAGAVLDSIAAQGATGDMAIVLGALDALPTTAAVDQALQMVLPTVDSGTTMAATNALNQFTDTVMMQLENRLTPSVLPDGVTGVSTGEEYLKGVDVWGQGFGNYTHQDPRGFSNGYNAAMWGVALGGDAPMYKDSLRGGASSGFSQSFVRSKDSSGKTDINSYQGTIYGGYQDENRPYYIDCALLFCYNTYNGSRHIAIGTIDRIATADYNGQQYSAYVGGGYTFKAKKLNITPMVSAQYMHLHVGNYTETGAGALNLTSAGQDYDMAETGLGTKFEYPLIVKYGTLVPEAHVKWLYDWVGDKQATNSTFAGGGGSFATTGFTPAQSSWDFGGRLTLYTKSDFSITANYDLEVKEDYWSQTGLLEATYKL